MENDIFNKWAPVIGTVSNDKLDWMKKYAESHSTYETATQSGFNLWGTHTATASESFPNLFPIAMQVSAKTIGLDLVSVQPMKGFGDEELLKKAEKKVTAVNRERQIDDILHDIPFEPLDIKDTDEYKEYEKTCGPKANLMYIDFKYGSATASN